MNIRELKYFLGRAVRGRRGWYLYFRLFNI
jgi:hypothetical protein